MSADRVPCIGLVAESQQDADQIRMLVDRAIIENVSWIRDLVEDPEKLLEDPLLLDNYLCWRGLEEHSCFLDIHDVRKLARDRRIRVHGHFPSLENPGKGAVAVADAQMHRKIFRLFEVNKVPIDLLVTTRDTDGDEARIEGVKQACQEFRRRTPKTFEFIAAICHKELELWFIVGFIPNSEEQTLFEQECRRLGFNPCQTTNRITSKRQDDARDAKKILDTLTRSDPRRKAQCLFVDFEILKERGQHCGLTNSSRNLKNVCQASFNNTIH